MQLAIKVLWVSLQAVHCQVVGQFITVQNNLAPYWLKGDDRQAMEYVTHTFAFLTKWVQGCIH